MNKTQNRYTDFAGLAACAIAVLVLTAGCSSSSRKQEKQNEAGQDPPVTEVFSLKRDKLSSVLRLPGELIAYQQVDLYAKVNSFVSKLYVDIGSEVKEGQMLVLMDAPELNAELDAASSKLKSQEAIYIASKSNYDRLYQTSQTPGTVSQNDLDQALAKKNSDLAQLEAAKSSYQEIADTRQYLEIRAPFSGVISARNVNTGAYVGPSGKGSELPIFTLQQQKKLRLVISVPEAYAGYINSKLKVAFDVRSLPDKKFTATVKRLAGALDNKLRSERIEMDVDNPDKILLPGMVAEVIVPLPATDSTFVVPKTAFVNSTEKTFVIRVADEKAEWVDVRKGRENADMMEIFGSLSPGDSLVKTASEEIRNGSLVRRVAIVKQ
jgi:RND family efflux transporter MFP subunit